MLCAAQAVRLGVRFPDPKLTGHQNVSLSLCILLGLPWPDPKLKTWFQHICLRQPLVCFGNTRGKQEIPQAAGKLRLSEGVKCKGKWEMHKYRRRQFDFQNLEKKMVPQHRNCSCENTYLKLDLGTKQSTAELSLYIFLNQMGARHTVNMPMYIFTKFTNLTPFTTEQNQKITKPRKCFLGEENRPPPHLPSLQGASFHQR